MINNNDALQQHYAKADKIMLIICYGLTLYSLGLAFWYDTWAEALVIGVGSALALSAVYSLAKGTPLCRAAMAAGLMIFTALHIHQAHGLIEIHFGIFALLAMLLYYRDWLPILVAAIVIAIHHLSFFYLQSNGSGVWVLKSLDMGVSVIFIHAVYVVVESALLIRFAVNLKAEAIQSMELMNVTNNILHDGHIDLTQRTSGSTPLLKRFDTYTADVEILASQVKLSVSDLSREGSELTVITDTMKEASHTQQHETNMIATSVEEMTAAIHEVSNHANLAAHASDQVDINAQEATHVSHKTRDAVNSLAEQISNAATTIESLNDQAKSIGSVLDVIRGVAEQTNLLALNAAIEAARAGEQGRGFAVVADEVRTLAQRTQKSTAEIDQMIEELQAGSQSAVQVIEHARKQANDCAENTSSTLTLMEQVSAAIKEINSMNAMIATASGEQGNVINEVSKSLSNILTASNQATQDSMRAANSANALQHVADKLNATSKGFHVS
ncbi:MAG: methyl-accepting chemotaxis protein [Spongiibacteraceae bacterium]